ncbi:formate dehydrogenase subunit delta [Pseudogulbenkiania sp. MAI-1]|uniref:formate dehydrogenase subunit delta n=1 Tax=Pseudogulbenkiania sp. MAI-1 TaxID=990370 RepID=UPI00045EB648|nr:formate dehydrogenase subunit delta [Pseudogulbenkiania sp. MAI-1]
MDTHHLARMANQIGGFFEAMPDREEALAGIVQHIKRYWEPRMRRELQLCLQQGGEAELKEIVTEALAKDEGWKV